MGAYDDILADATGKPRTTKSSDTTVGAPNPSKPMPKGPLDVLQAFGVGLKDIALPFAMQAAQPLTLGYRDKLAAWANDIPEDKKPEMQDKIDNYMSQHSNKVIDILGHTAGGLLGDVGISKGGAAVAPKVMGRPGFTGGGISGGITGAIGGVRDAWQDYTSGDPERVKRAIGDTLVSTAGGMSGGAATELLSPLVTWGGRVARSRMTPFDQREMNDLAFRAAEARARGYNATLPETMRLSNDPLLRNEVAPRLEGIMESGAKGQPGIGSVPGGSRIGARADLDRPASGPLRAEFDTRTSGPNNFYASAEEATREAKRAQAAADRTYGYDKPIYTRDPLPPSVERLRNQVYKEGLEGPAGVPKNLDPVPQGAPRSRAVIDEAINRETNPAVQRQARDVLADHHRRFAAEADAKNALDDFTRHRNAMENRPAVDMSPPQFTLGVPGKPFLRVGVDQLPLVKGADRRAAEILAADPMRAARKIGRQSPFTPWATGTGAEALLRYKDLMSED
jgi:hypothetical protein